MKSLREDGYTLIEVMMAVAVMTIGAVGLLAMQQASTRGNMEARQMTTATQIANLWLERVKRDSLNWNVGGATATAADLTRTRYLSAVPAPAVAPGWGSPTNVPAGESYAFDYWGRDTTATAGNNAQVFCVNTRYQWVFPGQAIRADVRVWWHRRGVGDTNSADGRLYRAPLCGVGSEAAITGDNRLRFVYSSTIVRWVQNR